MSTPPPRQSKRERRWLWGEEAPPSLIEGVQGGSRMLSLLCLHGPQSERSSLASLVPSVQWGQLSISGCLVGGRAVRAPDLGGGERLGPGLVGRAWPCPTVCPTPTSPEACFSVLLLLSQPQVGASTGLSVPTPSPELVECRPEVWGAPPACLLFSFPCIGCFPSLGPGEETECQRPGSGLTLRQMPVRAWAVRPPCVPMCPWAGAQRPPTTTVQSPM